MEKCVLCNEKAVVSDKTAYVSTLRRYVHKVCLKNHEDFCELPQCKCKIIMAELY